MIFKKKLLILSCTVLILIATNTLTSFASYYDGYLYVLNGRLTGNNTVNYYIASSATGYSQYINNGVSAWEYPRINGTGSYCTPYNNVYFSATSWADSEMDFQAESLPYANYIARTIFYSYENDASGNDTPVDPDVYNYDFCVVTFNKTKFDNLDNTGNISKQATTSHEIGHVLGFDENNKPGTIMSQSSYLSSMGTPLYRTVPAPAKPDNDSLNKRY